jgi:16S rRNA (cytosine967-C5)-methyltransferase
MKAPARGGRYVPRPKATIQELVERVLDTTGADRPADQALRDLLKSDPGLSRQESGQVAERVFAYYRWLGWLDTAAPRTQQIEQALALTESFVQSPDSISDSDLMARAVPGWLATAMNVTPAWLRSLQAKPQLWLRARRGQGSTLEAKLGQCHVFGAGPLGDILQYNGSEDLFRSPAFHAGEFELQDLSSQAVGLICDPQPGQTWWDACAGEGGKLLHLSDLMMNRGLIWASDRAEWRLQMLKRRAARAKVFNYRAALWAGGEHLPTKTKFDGVLVDAPCTGIGTWQRNPHGRWTVALRDVEELSQLQLKVLCHASTAVKPGGKLVYSVCTLTHAETTGLAEAFGKRFPEFEPQAVADPLASNASPAGKTPAPSTGGIWYWPQQSGGNGMFVAVWVRKAEGK